MLSVRLRATLGESKPARATRPGKSSRILILRNGYLPSDGELVLDEVIVIRDGDEAPRFEATIQDGSRVELADILEQGPLVLYFYPKDFTPG